MNKRFSVVQAKEVPGRDKPVWLRHGIAFQNDNLLHLPLLRLVNWTMKSRSNG